MKQDVNQVPYEMPSHLEAALVGFVDYYNHYRSHQALAYLTTQQFLAQWQSQRKEAKRH